MNYRCLQGVLCTSRELFGKINFLNDIQKNHKFHIDLGNAIKEGADRMSDIDLALYNGTKITNSRDIRTI